MAETLRLSGPLTAVAAREQLERGAAALARSGVDFDLAAVREVDSAGLAVVLGWVRAGQRSGHPVRIVAAPPSLRSLAELYGVTELLPLA